MVICNLQERFTINQENISTSHLPWSAWNSLMQCSSLGATFTGTLSTQCIALSAFILIQHTVCLTRSHAFSIPMWLLSNWSKICFCNAKGIIIHLPFIVTSLIFARVCLIDQNPPKLGSIFIFILRPSFYYVCL